MTISSTTSRVSYSGNGSTTAFSFPYYFLDEDDLIVVERNNTTGVETTKTITTHYTVAGAGVAAGGTVTMLVAPASGTTLIIYRDPSVVQGTDFVENDSLPVENVEQALDLLTMISQRLDNRMDRAVRLSDGFSPTFDPTLPVDLDDSADCVPLINATGDGWADAADWPTGDDINSAQTSATAAASSASAAATSATAAATSATAAATSATAAATSATAAATSATNAASSASSASTSASAASTSATNAASSASAASTSETNAASSASSASTSATNASTSATNAASSASSASTSASSASTSATAAAASATSAAAYAAAVADLWGGSAGGSADALTLTPSPALGAYSTGVRFTFLATASNTGAATVNISGLGNKSIKDMAGNALVAGSILNGYAYTLVYDGTNFRIISPPFTYQSSDISNLAIATSVSGNALTVAVKTVANADPSTTDLVSVGMRSATLTSGLYNRRTITSALSMTVSSGSTLGQTSNQASNIYVYLIDNAGTLELAVSHAYYPEDSLVSTTAEGGAGAADSATAIYSTTARSSVPIRLIGYILNTQTTAGTWASAGTKIQLLPGQGVKNPTVQRFTSGSGTYYKPAGCIRIEVEMIGGGAGGTAEGTISTAPTAGGNSTFGSNLTAGGGSIGTYNAAGGQIGGAGGTNTISEGTTLVNVDGGRGGGSSYPNGVSVYQAGGNGGSGFYGGAPGIGAANVTGPSAAANSGGGGAGAGPSATVAPGVGGGSGGFIRVLITSPATSYAYAVGAGGSAGTGSINGGAGGSGLIVVTEYYN